MLAILINAMVIFLMYFPTLEGNIYLEVVDRIIIFFFFVEACVKLKVLSPRGYFKSNWNRFDFFIVSLENVFCLP